MNDKQSEFLELNLADNSTYIDVVSGLPIKNRKLKVDNLISSDKDEESKYKASSTFLLKQVKAELEQLVEDNLNKDNEHITNYNNPHKVNKVQIGLESVDNTSDLDKPVSILQREAIDNVQLDLDNHKSDIDNPHKVTKEQIGLDKVENLSPLEMPVSTEQQIALNGKVTKTGNETITGIKTFTNSPIVPTPTTDMQGSTKKYVDDAKSGIQSKQIIAGNGLTGGGDLSTDRTLSVVSANDGITVNADNIQLNTIDNVTTPSITKPLSANQGKVLNDNLVQLGADVNKIPDNLEPALAEILNQQNKRIESLEIFIKNMLFKSGQFDTLEIVKEFNIYGKTNMYVIKDTAPSIIPDFYGQFYINTSGTGTIYQAKGISSTSDWKQTSN